MVETKIRASIFPTATVLIMAATLIAEVESGVTVEIKFREFNNPTGRDYNGKSCEVVSSCDTFFKLCIKLTQHITTSFTNCDYKPSTERYIKSNNINFQTQDTNVDKIIRIGRDRWDGFVSFYMEVWDKDFITNHDKIDTFSYSRRYTPGVKGSGFESHVTIYGARSSDKTALYFTVKVSCYLNYYGANCSKYCKAQDDARGHYYCNSTGDRVCSPNWYILPDCLKNCVPQDDEASGHYVCASNGSRVCRPNWYNLPDCKIYCRPQNDTINGHFGCTSAGKKVCHVGWYGEKCTIFCLPQTDGHYNCSEAGARICHENWRGPYCNRFCKPSNDSLNGFYNCSSTGQKICKINYYGLNCTVFCLAVNSTTRHFVCDKNTGANVCLENWTGNFCNVSRVVSLSTTVTQRLTSVSFRASRSSVLTTIISANIQSVSETMATISRVTSHTSSTVDLRTYSTANSLFVETAVPSSTKLRSTIPLSTWKPFASFTSTPTHSNTNLITSTKSSQEATTTTTMTSVRIERETTTTVKVVSATTTPTLTTTTTKKATTPSKSSSTHSKSSSAVTPKMITTATPSVDPKKEDSGKGSKNANWLVETKEGKTVLIGAIFAFLLLGAVILLIVMYLRLPKRSNSREFENLKDIPDEWKTEEKSEKSFFNPLYKVPENLIEGNGKKKKKKSKLEKFYSKKSPESEPEIEQDMNALSNGNFDDSNEQTGIFQNPLFGIRNQGYDTKEETGV